MNGSQLISELLMSIYEYKELENEIFEEKLIGDDDIVEASRILISEISNKYLKSFIDNIVKTVRANPDSFLTNEYINNGKCTILDFGDDPLKGRNRNFYYSDTNIGFASSISFFNHDEFTDFSKSEDDKLWKQIEYFLERTFSGEILELNRKEMLLRLFTIIETNDKTKGLFINKTELSSDFKRLYSYIYLYALNFEYKLKLDSDIVIHNIIINPALSLDINVTYEQYFDVLDVLNEVNHTSDIISRFLKIYHVLEYLTYRIELSKIVSQVDQGKSFIMKIIQLSDDLRKKELDMFVRNFKKLFESDLTKLKIGIESVLNPSNRVYIYEKWLGINFDATVIKHYGILIYKIRNSIVHNKESENHISISNPEEYRIVIPVIRKLIEVLQELIIEKISSNQNLIQYTKDQLKFY